MASPDTSAVRRRLPRRLPIALFVVIAIGAALGAAIAGSAPKKPFSAYISAPPNPGAVTTTTSTSIGGETTVGIRIQNDTKTQSLGSANITLPDGVPDQVAISSVQLASPGPPASAILNGKVIELRNLGVAPGGSALVTFTAAVSCTAPAASYSFGIAVKQSNDFSGAGNDFNQLSPLLLSTVGQCVPCPPKQTCTALTTKNDTTASVTATVGPDGGQTRVSVGVDDAPENCEGYAETIGVVAFDVVSAGASEQTRVVVQQKNPSRAANTYKLCFRGDAPDAVPAILPACTLTKTTGGAPATATNAPCALPPEIKRNVLTLQAITPPGDPWIWG